MLDMLHYLFETDTLVDEEVQKAKQKMRGSIYKLLYVRDYTWLDDASGYRDFGSQDANGGYSGPAALEHKPYIPPTPVNPTSPLPYGAALGAPLG